MTTLPLSNKIKSLSDSEGGALGADLGYKSCKGFKLQGTGDVVSIQNVTLVSAELDAVSWLPQNLKYVVAWDGNHATVEKEDQHTK